MKKLLAMGMAAMMALSLAACGGSASSAASSSEAASSEAASSEAATSEAAGTDASATGKTWVIATDTVFKPFEYTDADGNFVGIDVDIVAAIAEDQGFSYELKSLGWDAAIAACQAGQADGMIAGASITQERKDSGWIFSDGYYNATQTMTVPANSDITGFGDLSGKTVAVKTGTQGASYAESLKDEYGFNITYFEDSPTMYQAVLGGQCAACFEDTPIMQASIKDGGLALKVLEDTANEGAPYGFAIFNADNQELIDMFNAGLANIQANGKYDEIIAKYLG
ncbi:transporter substrate-binding domain-containing protein [uncultured Subdoligranulum sp.]|uniref:transporter substrate-binding domain-containing protein n=1 Tax=uncultured Subdoligranulum sp. TaxID=512298 RepID=UPI0025E71B42|nr:transporter substrate-binding domain-containing protein [uncultured Subdoligranulum sp.]